MDIDEARADLVVPDLSGRSLGNWRLRRLLGVGGFGAVYEAHNLNIEKLAAVKVLHPHLTVRRDLQQRFLSEAGAASRSRHPGIVEFYDGGFSDDGLCYMVMELLSGQTLLAHLKQRGSLGALETARLGQRLADALADVHARGVVHRDLKAENIFLTTEAEGQDLAPKILDFGIAKLRTSPDKTATGLLMGTPAYMPPEQWRSEPDIDGRTDIYSLGAILYLCLTGRLPFDGKTQYEWLMAHLHTPVPDVTRLAPGAPAPLCELLARMLQKERQARVQTMGEVRDALGALLQAPLPAAARAPMKRPRGEPSAQTSLGAGERPAASPAGSPLRRGLLAAAAACAIAGLGYWLRGPVREEPSWPPPAPAQQGAGARAVARAEPARLPQGMEDLGAFALGRQQVTIGEFRRFVEERRITRAEPWPWRFPVPKGDGQPMFFLSQELGEAYCRWRYPAGGRLPTAAELAAARRVPAVQLSGPFGEWTGDRRGGQAVALSEAQRPTLAPTDGLLTPYGLRCVLPRPEAGWSP